jgi:uncharacterized protein affecting Mg2+/Co2+ transport
MYYQRLLHQIALIKQTTLNILGKFPFNQAEMSDRLHNNYTNKEREKGLQTLIQAYFKKIPFEIYTFYKFLNGQMQIEEFEDLDCGFFGGYEFYHQRYDFRLYPFFKPDCEFLANLGFLTLAVSEENNIRYMVDMFDNLQCGKGAVFSFVGRIQLPDNKALYRIFVLNSNFMDFLTNFQKYTYDTEKNLLDNIDTLTEPASDVTTAGIRVRATAHYCPWELVDKQLFIYQIRLSDNGVKGRYQLTNRYWKITAEGSEPQEVAGPGVIGLFPEISPGCQDFTYESCSHIERFAGKMEGKFYFKNLDDPESSELAVQVGPFKYDFPKNCAILNFAPHSKKVECLYTNIASGHFMIDT